MSARVASTAVGGFCLAVAVLAGGWFALLYTAAIVLPVPLVCLWFPHQVGAFGTSNVFGMSWTGLNARGVRFIGWFTLVLVLLWHVVVVLPIAFPG